MKRCSKCGLEKPFTEFHKNKTRADGYNYRCKKCRAEDTAQYYVEHKEVIKERRRAYLKTRAGKKIHTKSAKKHQAKFPDRKKAISILNHAVCDGKIKRKPCLFCNTAENIEGHHTDYAKPLNVVWLCRKHHRELHGIP